MQVLLVRHALPVRVEASEGVADPGLAPLGVEQAEALAGWIETEGLSAIWSSPLRRARETSDWIAKATGLEVAVDDDLVEYDQGTFYIPIEEMKNSGDPRYQAFLDGDFAGIDIPAFRTRAVAAVERIIAAHPGGKVAVVCHGGVVNAYLTHVLGIEAPFPFQLSYTSVTRVMAARSGERSVGSVNEAAHVRGLLPAT